MDTVIDASQMDPTFANQIAAESGGEHIRRCFSCGTCTASCPVREVTERYNPRRIIRMVQLGMYDRVLASDFVWLCSACYTCQERCPQGVHVTDLMVALRNIATRAGRMHPGFRPQVEALRATGRMYEIDEFDNKKRAKADLPPLPLRLDDVPRLLGAVGLAPAGDET